MEKQFDPTIASVDDIINYVKIKFKEALTPKINEKTPEELENIQKNIVQAAKDTCVELIIAQNKLNLPNFFVIDWENTINSWINEQK